MGLALHPVAPTTPSQNPKSTNRLKTVGYITVVYIKNYRSLLVEKAVCGQGGPESREQSLVVLFAEQSTSRKATLVVKSLSSLTLQRLCPLVG